MKRILISCLACLSVLLAAQAQNLLWTISTDTNMVYLGSDVMTDGQDNVILGAVGNNTAYILKYNKDGTPLLAAGSSDEASYEAMTTDKDDRLILAGRQKNGSQWDAMIMVFDTEGNPQFTQWHNYSNKDDVFNDVLTDPGLNIFACGSAYNANTEQCGLLARYAPDGTPVWVEHFGETNHHISFLSVKMDVAGNLHVVGRKSGTSPSPISLISRVYSPAGMLLSEYDALVGGYMEAHPLFNLLDEGGSHYIGGYVLDGSMHTAFLMKLIDNNLAWLQLGPDGSSFYNGCLTPQGYVACCGEAQSLSGDAYYALFTSGGGLEQENQYDSPYGLEDVLLGITAEGEYLYFCGASEGLGTLTDMLVLKTDMTLTTMWELRYNSFNNGYEVAWDIDLDTEGNVLLAGQSMSTTGNFLEAWKYTNPLRIEEKEADRMISLQVYPNPSADRIFFRLENASGQLYYEIISKDGRHVSAGNLPQAEYQSLSITTLPAGSYLLRIYNGNITYGARFVKQ